MSATALQEGKWTVTKARLWGQYRHPKDRTIVRLPAYDEARTKYIAKGFEFLNYCDESTPAAQADTSPKVLDTLVPKNIAGINPEPVTQPVIEIKKEENPEPVIEPELYVAEHPYKSKKKEKRKYTRRSK